MFKSISHNIKIKLSLILLFLFISFLWVHTFNLYDAISWNTPLGYNGDLFWVLSIAKGYQFNEVVPFWVKQNNFLNAPFGANWSSIPITEDFIYMFMGYLARITNIGFAHNITLLIAHLLAGLSFFYVTKEFNCKLTSSFAFSILYSCSHYLWLRGSAHIILTYCFVVPIAILILKKLIDENIQNKKTILKYCVLSFLIGCFNPYYTYMFVIFLIFIQIYLILKSKYNFSPSFMIIASFVGFSMMNLDTLSYKGDISVLRNLIALEVYGMKIPEFFFPQSQHRLGFWHTYGIQHYYNVAFVKGESWSSYIGIIGSLGLLVLIVNCLISIKKSWKPLEVQTSIALNWIVLFSLIGGINLLLGVFGFQMFRASNRFSIYIYTILLIYLCIKVSKLEDFKRLIILPLILVVGLLDNLPIRNVHFQDPIKKKFNDDILMAKKLEQTLKPNSMVFQFPYSEFPEVGPKKGMGDYEHFRPYIHTSTLRYSYGNAKGTGLESWQKKIKLAKDFTWVNDLKNYGFSAIYINKKAYETSYINGITDFLKQELELIYETQEIVIFKIQPSKEIKDIELANIFNSGWYISEKTHRWARDNSAKIIFYDCCDKFKNLEFFSFDISSFSNGEFEVFLNNKIIHKKRKFLRPGTFINIKVPTDNLKKKNVIHIKTNLKPKIASKNDPRNLTFMIKNFPGNF